MSLEELKSQKVELLQQFRSLAAKKAKLYSDVDPTLPMSEGERAMTEECSKLASDLNKICKEIRKIQKS